MISVHVGDVFMEVSLAKLENTKEMIKLKFNTQDSGKLKKVSEYTMNGVVTQTFCTIKLL